MMLRTTTDQRRTVRVGRAQVAAAMLLLASLHPQPLAAQTNGLPPYEPQLLRLLEVIGSVQFLRQLCAPTEPSSWRERAAALIEAEGDTDARRAKLTAAFNRGYRAFQSYRECNDAAIYAIDRYMREGEALGRDILVRYGG